jgi:hypothetical protein
VEPDVLAAATGVRIVGWIVDTLTLWPGNY